MDKQVVEFLYQNRLTSWDDFLLFLTEYNTVLTILTLLVLAYLVFIAKKYPAMYFYVPFWSILLGAGLANLFKLFFQRLRPYDVMENVEALTSGGGYSFPSGHSTEVFALLFSLWFVTKNKMIFLFFFLWALLIAYTRMAFGVHYPTDVLAGMVLGLAVSYVVYVFFVRRLEY